MTTRERLNQHIASIQALRHAITRLKDAAPPASSKREHSEHLSRIARIQGVLNEVDEIAQAIADQPRSPSPLRLP